MRGKASQPSAAPGAPREAFDELVYIGLRCIGALRRNGRRWEAFGVPGERSLGTFDKHDAAARAVYDHDVIERLAGAVEHSGPEAPQ